MGKTLGRRVLERAVQNAGSVNRAARLLGISPGALEVFVEGKRVIPDSLFMQLVDLAMEEGAAPAGASGAPLPGEKPKV